ncbi:Hypothetical protein GL50581_4372 [Giardia duodenalis ATCC 50581]|uniref:Uncharacterized protein n=2 Tax=Giardia intestinalis TaxID=5741 RepID=C6LZY6_GIAIB|nr:Hypothetical protein GL50581_4372 [Giardia intestinalis ATCC 50581]
MSSLTSVNGCIVFASPKRLFCLQRSLISGAVQGDQWILGEWHHGIALEDRIILGCTGGKLLNEASVLIVLLDDKRILLIWLPLNFSSASSPISYSITSTYRKASAAIISGEVLIIADRFGSIYSHSLVSLSLDKSKHNDVSTPIDKAVAFDLAEPVAGRCTSITSLVSGPNDSVYFSDRDGIIVGTEVDALYDIRHIWSTRNMYVEQVLPWNSESVLALGNLGVSCCSCSRKKLSSRLIVSNTQLDSPDASTARRCICIARQGLVAFIATLTVTMVTSPRMLNIASLTISKLTANDPEMSAKDIFTYDIGVQLTLEDDAPTLEKISRSRITHAYDLISLHDSSVDMSGDHTPLFLDSLGTLFCVSNGLISAYPKVLDDGALIEWTSGDRVVTEHAHRQVKL